jgi:tetratricopeptide (TPR) repeat protein
MRIIAVTTLFLLLSSAGIAFADSDAAKIYNRANKLYADKEYNRALELYLELVDRGIENAALYYNLANTYFKAGIIGKAVLYYERALYLKPLDRDIRDNLKFVRMSLEDKISPLYSERMHRVLQLIGAIFNLKVVLVIELFFFSALCALLILRALSHSGSRLLRQFIILCGIFFAVSIAGMTTYVVNERRHPAGIVLEKEVDVKSSPIPESEKVFELHEGTKVKIIERRNEWIRFRIADGREGWTRADTIALIHYRRNY